MTVRPRRTAAAFHDGRYRAFGRELRVRAYLPSASASGAGVLLWHGGGFVGGSIETIAPLAEAMAVRLDVPVATPEYTLAGERPFPAAAEDAFAALAWAAGCVRRVALVGVEAGANLAAVAAMMARDRGAAAPVAQVLVAPMLEPVAPAYVRTGADRLHPYAAPACCTRLARLAPALIITAAGDPQHDEAESFGAKLIASGVTTQVSRLPRIESAANEWTEEVWAAVAAFLGPRIR